MPKTKKSNSKRKTFIHRFDPTSKKGLLALFLLSFVLVGGAYGVYTTFAASDPLSSIRTQVKISSVKAADEEAYTGTVNCISVKADTGYGPLSNCIQLHADGKRARPGLYSTTSKTFFPSGTVWLYKTATGSAFTDTNFILPATKCNNLDNYFVGSVSLTGYGTARFGHIYRMISVREGVGFRNVWQVKFAYMNDKGNCSPTISTWMNASAWNN